jgi:hypothetical protein
MKDWCVTFDPRNEPPLPRLMPFIPFSPAGREYRMAAGMHTQQNEHRLGLLVIDKVAGQLAASFPINQIASEVHEALALAMGRAEGKVCLASARTQAGIAMHSTRWMGQHISYDGRAAARFGSKRSILRSIGKPPLVPICRLHRFDRGSQFLGRSSCHRAPRPDLWSCH